METKYINIVELTEIWKHNLTGMQVILGNEVQEFHGTGWEVQREPTPEDIEQLPIVYGWVSPDDWVQLVKGPYEFRGKSLVRERVKVVRVFQEKIEVVYKTEKFYVEYYHVKLGTPKVKKNVLQATKMANKKSGNSFYKVKE